MPYQSVAPETLAAGQDLGRFPVHFSGDCHPTNRRDCDICRKRNSGNYDNRSSRYLLNICVTWISPFGQAFLPPRVNAL